MYIRIILWKVCELFNDLACFIVIHLIDSYYTNAHEESHRHESDIGVEGR